MIDHLRKAALSNCLVDRVIAEEEDVIYGADGLEEGRVVDKDGLGEHQR